MLMLFPEYQVCVRINLGSLNQENSFVPKPKNIFLHFIHYKVSYDKKPRFPPPLISLNQLLTISFLVIGNILSQLN